MPEPGSLDWAALSAQVAAEDHPSESATQSDSVAASTTVAAEAPAIPDPGQIADPAPPAVPDVVVSESQTPSSETAAQKIFDVPDDALFRVKIDGEEKIISHKEYKDILRQNATVTQRYQNLAETRDKMNAELNEWIQKLDAREKELAARAEAGQKPDPNAAALQALVDALQGKKPAEPPDPNTVLTVGELAQREAKLKAEFEAMTKAEREQFKKDLEAAQTQVATQSRQQKELAEFYGQVDSLIAKPEYAAVSQLVPHARAHIMSVLNKLNPATREEALALSEEWLKERKETFRKLAVSEQQAKEADAVKQKMESNSGSTPMIKGTSKEERVKSYIGKNGKPNWDAMLADASKHQMP